MLFSPNEIQDCLSKARDLAHQYKLKYIGADNPEKSVDQLADICRTYMNKKIAIYELEIKRDESSVLGACFVLKEENAYDICFVQELNYCWRRYVICKELFHAVLDHDGHYNMDIAAHVEEVTVSIPVEDSDPSEAVKVEWLAEFAAMEFLFPYESRKKEYSTLNGASFNYLAIAQKYRIPQVMVEKYLSEDAIETFSRFAN